MNQFKTLPSYEPTDPPWECNIQPPAVHFKSWTTSRKASPVVSDIMGKLNNNYVDNGDVEVQPSEYPFELTSEFVPDPDTTPITSIDDDEMGQIL